MFHKAEKKQALLRLALCGPAGSGKTYSALQVAQGLAPDGRIAMIDTEAGSGELYAELCAYDVATLAPPYSPARYIEAIAAAGVAGYDVLIIDSLSHAWTGQGGVLEMHDNAAASQRNRFAAWREVTPHHNALVDAILAAPLHVIITMRTKTAYEVIDDGSGKKKPVKIGMAPVQREGLEYEFTLVLDLSVEGHVATATKDRTGTLDGQHFIPSIETGETLQAWLTSGADPAEASAGQLAELKAGAADIEALAELNDYWRRHAGDIARLTQADQGLMKKYCSCRKAEILQATDGTGVPAAAQGAAAGNVHTLPQQQAGA